MEFYLSLLTLFGFRILLGLSAWVVILTGQISMAQAGFYAVGAYTAGMATAMWGWPLVPALLLGAVALGRGKGFSRIIQVARSLWQAVRAIGIPRVVAAIAGLSTAIFAFHRLLTLERPKKVPGLLSARQPSSNPPSLRGGQVTIEKGLHLLMIPEDEDRHPSADGIHFFLPFHGGFSQPRSGDVEKVATRSPVLFPDGPFLIFDRYVSRLVQQEGSVPAPLRNRDVSPRDPERVEEGVRSGGLAPLAEISVHPLRPESGQDSQTLEAPCLLLPVRAGTDPVTRESDGVRGVDGKPLAEGIFASRVASREYGDKVSHLRLARDLSEIFVGRVRPVRAVRLKQESPASEGERRGSRRTARWLTLYRHYRDTILDQPDRSQTTLIPYLPPQLLPLQRDPLLSAVRPASKERVKVSTVTRSEQFDEGPAEEEMATIGSKGDEDEIDLPRDNLPWDPEDEGSGGSYEEEDSSSEDNPEDEKKGLDSDERLG